MYSRILPLLQKSHPTKNRCLRIPLQIGKIKASKLNPHFACNTNFDIRTDAHPRDHDARAGINLAPYDEIEMRFNQRRSSASLNNETALHEYLQRQGRNEYINLAS